MRILENIFPRCGRNAASRTKPCNRSICKAVALSCAVLLTGIARAETYNIYVSPVGSDDLANNGLNVNAPVRTLARAQSVARSYNGSGNVVTVNIMAGTYTEQLTFDSNDSDTTWQAYNWGNVTISGGRSVGPWVFVNGIYQTDFSGELFRQLYIDGVRATRARSRESYIVRISYDETIGGEKVPFAIEVNNEDIPAMSGMNTSNAPELHFGQSGHKFNIVRIRAIAPRSATTSWIVPMLTPEAINYNSMKPTSSGPQTRQAFFFQNAKELGMP